VLELCTTSGFKIADVNVAHSREDPDAVVVSLEVHGKQSIPQLTADLGEIDGVLNITTGDVDDMFE
jgi:hypothetical protein